MQARRAMCCMVFELRLAGLHHSLVSLAELPKGPRSLGFCAGAAAAGSGAWLQQKGSFGNMLSLGAVQVLQQVVAERDLDVWVHPVPPVLDETRHIVMPFNDLMRRRVRSMRRALGSGIHLLHGLD